MEKMLRARFWERHGASILSKCPTSPKSLWDPQFKSSMNTETKYYGKRCSHCLTTGEIPKGVGAINIKLPVLSNITTMLGSGHITVDKRDKGPFFHGG